MADEQPGGDPGSDWTVEVADRIESVVGAVRDRTTVPITKVARVVVFGVRRRRWRRSWPWSC